MMANFCPRLFGVVLGISCASVRKLRDSTGSAATCSATITDDGCDFATSTSGVSATTVSVSDNCEMPSLKSMVRSEPIVSTISRFCSANPESSTAIAYGAGCSATAR